MIRHAVWMLSLAVALPACLFIDAPTNQGADMGAADMRGPSDMSGSPDVSNPPDAVSPGDATIVCPELCDEGTSRCADNGDIEVCQGGFETECPAYEVVESCGAGLCGQLDEFAYCGCTDVCDPATDGASCSELNEAVTCTLDEEFGCHTLTYEDCGDEFCEEGVCLPEPSCPDACDDTSAPPTCDGNAILTCRPNPTFGCDRFKRTECGDEKVCLQGECKDPPECEIGDPDTCNEAGTAILSCNPGPNGPRLTRTECGDNQACQAGSCVCEDNCEPGEASCGNGPLYQVCEKDSDGCFTLVPGRCQGGLGRTTLGCDGSQRVVCWSRGIFPVCEMQSCPDNQTCSQGSCAP